MAVRRRIIWGRPIKQPQKRKVDLGIDIKDFGPISSGKVALKPLTIFIGPNNSGKSYAAMLIHSIFESHMPARIKSDLPPPLRSRFLYRGLKKGSDGFSKDFENEKAELIDDIKKLNVGEELEVPQPFLKKIFDYICEDLYEQSLSDEIKRSYATQLNNLVRVGKRSFALKINFNSKEINLRNQKNELEIKEHSYLDIKILIKVTGKSRRGIEITKDKEENKHIISLDLDLGEEYKFLDRFFVDAIFDICASEMFKSVAMYCYYLPAARSGILQGHKALAANIIKRAPLVGIEELEIPKLSGVVSDFISSIIELPDEEGQFYKFAQELEKELIKGEIIIPTLESYAYPEIKYRFQDTEIPLHRTSSTVSELAPLILYLKYIIEPGSILIIEEPEAHLHPKNQLILAKFLVKLIRKEVNVIITTHSEYLLEQISNFIMLSKIVDEKRAEKYRYDKEDYLKYDDVAAYVFKYDNESGGNRITAVNITEDDGISQEEFIKIQELLYDETIKLQRDLGGNDL